MSTPRWGYDSQWQGAPYSETQRYYFYREENPSEEIPLRDVCDILTAQEEEVERLRAALVEAQVALSLSPGDATEEAWQIIEKALALSRGGEEKSK